MRGQLSQPHPCVLLCPREPNPLQRERCCCGPIAWMHLQILHGAHSMFNGAVTRRWLELAPFNPRGKCWQRPGRCRQGGKTHQCHLSLRARALLLAELGPLMSHSPPGSGQGWCPGPCQALLARTFEAPKPLVSDKLHLGVCSEVVFFCSQDIRQPLCDSIKTHAALPAWWCHQRVLAFCL